MAHWTLSELNNWTDLSVIPNVIGLNISYSKLKEIPPKVFKLITLQTLFCFNNELTCLPKEIGQLINLQNLFCYDNITCLYYSKRFA